MGNVSIDFTLLAIRIGISLGDIPTHNKLKDVITRRHDRKNSSSTRQIEHTNCLIDSGGDSAQTAPRIGDADGFGGWTRIVADALGELAVAFAQVVGAHVFGFHLTVSRHCDWADRTKKKQLVTWFLEHHTVPVPFRPERQEIFLGKTRRQWGSVVVG